MHAAFLRSEYYGGSATTRCPQRASRLPTNPLDAGREGRHRVVSHVHWCPFRRGRRPAIPRRHRRGPHIAVLARASRRPNHTDDGSRQVKSHDLPSTAGDPSTRSQIADD